MATFCNQSSNLSALGSALESFTESLDVSEERLSKLTQAEHRENVNRFLISQTARIRAMDASLMEATTHVLPPTAEAKTVTELAELCRIVQEASRQKLGLLRTRLDLVGIKVAWEDSITSPLHTEKQGKTGHTNQLSGTRFEWFEGVGGPLDCVVEGDVETEGATTPGSLLQQSPFASASKSDRKKSLTPTTPTMNKFSFSSGTTSILDRMSLSSSKRRTPSDRRNETSKSLEKTANSGMNFEGFQEEDDMISLNTSVEPIANHIPSSQSVFQSPVLKAKEERSQFLKRMESMLERVEEELIHENRPTDEKSEVSYAQSSTNQNRIARPSDEQSFNNQQFVESKQVERPSNNKFLDEIEHEEGNSTEESQEDETNDSHDVDIDDDSTNVIATLVADNPQPMVNDIKRPVPIIGRPTQIVVDKCVSSPANTNLTMDGTMMNETFLSALNFGDEHGNDDNASTMTPILDRYRLDADDNSIGIRVVPNKRGIHPKYSSDRSYTRNQETSAPASTQFYMDDDGFLSPKGLPGTVSARKTKQYRKTPYPKKQLEQTFDDENLPNAQTLAFSPDSSANSFSASNPESSFSVPPLRPRSFGFNRTSRTNATKKAHSLPHRSNNDLQNERMDV